ncbi:26646_t:CDS:1, partial [Racocetra persica]
TMIVDLELIKLNIANKAITLDYLTKNKDQQKHYTSLVRVCDKALISRDRYQKLAAVDPNIVREYLIKQRHKEIDNHMEQYLPILLFNIDQPLEVKKSNDNSSFDKIITINNQTENAVYRSITSLLMVLVPVLTTSDLIFLYPGDKINIKIGGDGRNVSRKQSYVILAISILNE